MMRELTNRVTEMDTLQIAYLSKGLVNLQKYCGSNQALTNMEFEFRTWLLARLNEDLSLI